MTPPFQISLCPFGGCKRRASKTHSRNGSYLLGEKENKKNSSVSGPNSTALSIIFCMWFTIRHTTVGVFHPWLLSKLNSGSFSVPRPPKICIYFSRRWNGKDALLLSFLFVTVITTKNAFSVLIMHPSSARTGADKCHLYTLKIKRVFRIKKKMENNLYQYRQIWFKLNLEWSN